MDLHLISKMKNTLIAFWFERRLLFYGYRQFSDPSTWTTRADHFYTSHFPFCCFCKLDEWFHLKVLWECGQNSKRSAHRKLEEQFIMAILANKMMVFWRHFGFLSIPGTPWKERALELYITLKMWGGPIHGHAFDVTLPSLNSFCKSWAYLLKS